MGTRPAEMLPRPLLVEVTGRLAALDGEDDLWPRLADAAWDTQELPGEVALRPHGPSLLDLPDAIDRLIPRPPVRAGRSASGGLTLVLERPGDRIRELADTMDADERAALDTVLRRALDPFDALATWPLDTLFAPDEVAGIEAAAEGQGRPVAPAEPARFRWSPGGPMDYAGYACVIMKLTRLCNLRCVYCNDWRSGRDQRMGFDVQLALVSKLLGDPAVGTTEIVWHGGEATLMGRRAFLRLLALERRFLRPGQTLRNRLQTNATTLDRDWVRFLSRYRFTVGTSVDGPAEMHDRTRPAKGGKPSLDKVRRGIALLREERMLSHVYVVVGRGIVDLGAEALLAFLQEEGIERVGLLPARPDNGPALPDAEFLPRDVYGRFLLDMHRARARAPKPWVAIRELDAMIRAAGDEMAGHCELLGNCGGHFFSVDPNGDVAHCDKFVGAPEFTLGNIVEDGFAEIRARARPALERTGAAAPPPSPGGCRHAARCQGWCPHERYVARRHAPEAGTGCCGLGALFDALTSEARTPDASPPGASPPDARNAGAAGSPEGVAHGG
jgi:uncharacterized protein